MFVNRLEKRPDSEKQECTLAGTIAPHPPVFLSLTMGSWSWLDPGLGEKVDSLSRARLATRPQRIRSLVHVAISYILKLLCINDQHSTVSQCFNMASQFIGTLCCDER